MASIVGKSISRVDAVAKVTGQARYVDDYYVPHMLHAKYVRSTIANGWVKSLDISKAKALPGVVAVFTYEDVPHHPYPTAGHPYHKDPARQDVADRRLLTRRVRLWGDEMAVVVAEDELTAAMGAALVNVEYEEYHPILTAEDALAPGAVEIHTGTGNVLQHSEYSLGDMDAALARADYVCEGSYATPMVAHCAMETYSAFAYQDSSGRIVVVSSTQIPHICRRIVGQALGLPWGRVRVIKPYIGGGFGGKQDVVVEPMAAFLAFKLPGRTVKVELSREECFVASRVRHAIAFRLMTGAYKDGTLAARDMEAVSLNGAYASHGHAIVSNGWSKFYQLYNQEALSAKLTTVYTNTPAAGAMRGYGVPQALFALECHMDDMAAKLGIDPVDMRLRNIVPNGFVDVESGIKIHSTGLRECLLMGKERIRWEEKRQDISRRQGRKRRGVGMACFTYASGTYPHNLELAGARLIMNEDGSVQLMVGATEIGQGSDTVLTQMAAETLGLPVGMVHLITEQDTDVTPVDLGAYASRQTYITGMAVRQAAEEMKAAVLEYARGLTDIPVQALDTADGWIVYNYSGERIMPIGEVALDSHSDLVKARPFTSDVSVNARVNAFSYGCTFVAVEVDLGTGKVDILELYNIHDSGRIINPQTAAGQVHGGVSMSLGFALYEQLLFDGKTGQPLNNNMLDYKLMTALDTPDIQAVFVETDEPTAPYGNKSLGEPPAISPAPAIRNALLDATGLAFNELPLTPQRLVARFKAEGLI